MKFNTPEPQAIQTANSIVSLAVLISELQMRFIQITYFDNKLKSFEFRNSIRVTRIHHLAAFLIRSPFLFWDKSAKFGSRFAIMKRLVGRTLHGLLPKSPIRRVLGICILP